jgi:hypothetical protein
VEDETADKILRLLRPYAANWSGSLARGDLVIPQKEITGLVREICELVHDVTRPAPEVTDSDLFQALNEVRRLPSLQDQVTRLQASFRILKR